MPKLILTFYLAMTNQQLAPKWCRWILSHYQLPQPRRYFDPQKLEQLIQSVKAHGILENLLVRPLKGKEGVYELVAGERRFRAAQSAELTEVPVTNSRNYPMKKLFLSLL